MRRMSSPDEQDHSCGDSSELESERSGLFAQVFFLALGLSLVFVEEHAFIVGLSCSQQVVDDTGQLVGCCGDGLGRSQPSAQAAIEVAQMGTRAAQRLGRNAQGGVGAAVALAGLRRQDLAAALFVGGAQGQPTGEGSNVGKPAEVGADLCQQNMGCQCADAGDGSQVDAEDPV